MRSYGDQEGDATKNLEPWAVHQLESALFRDEFQNLRGQQLILPSRKVQSVFGANLKVRSFFSASLKVQSFFSATLRVQNKDTRTVSILAQDDNPGRQRGSRDDPGAIWREK